jgi:20S proteasome subunit beta 3
MADDHYIAITADRRFGKKMLTVSTSCEKVFQINGRIFLGFAGVMTDVETVHEKLRYDANRNLTKEIKTRMD